MVSSRPSRRRGRRRRGGYALAFVLLMVVLASLAATMAVNHAQVRIQREREADLLFVGDEFRRALQSYHAAVPSGGVPQYPQRLADLVADTRFPNTIRHLRRIYADPMTGKVGWVLEMQQDRIIGVHSISNQVPLRRVGFPAVDAAFANAKSYGEWRFLAGDSAGAVPANAAPAPVAPAQPAASGRAGAVKAPDAP
jgi:type II secretory pathway pseudopilin PulG